MAWNHLPLPAANVVIEVEFRVRHAYHDILFFIIRQGDGKVSYDVSKDSVPNMIGKCAVRVDVFRMTLRVLPNGTGRLSPHQHSDETQGYLCQGHGIGRMLTHAFLNQSSLLMRIQVKIQWNGCGCFDRCLVLMSRGED